jgi:hypothetical protein
MWLKGHHAVARILQRSQQRDMRGFWPRCLEFDDEAVARDVCSWQLGGTLSNTVLLDFIGSLLDTDGGGCFPMIMGPVLDDQA